jgi:hypothetical protein
MDAGLKLNREAGACRRGTSQTYETQRARPTGASLGRLGGGRSFGGRRGRP